MLFRSPTAKTPWAQPPPSSRGPGRCPFKAVTRVRIPLGARTAWSCGAAWSARHPVKVEVAGSNPVRTAPGRTRVRPRAGSSVGTSVRLKIGRSAVRPRPCPPEIVRLTCSYAKTVLTSRGYFDRPMLLGIPISAKRSIPPAARRCGLRIWLRRRPRTASRGIDTAGNGRTRTRSALPMWCPNPTYPRLVPGPMTTTSTSPDCAHCAAHADRSIVQVAGRQNECIACREQHAC
jgi:hypothetical protein